MMKKILLSFLILLSSVYCYAGSQKITGNLLITSGNILPSGNLNTTGNFYTIGATDNYFINSYVSTMNSLISITSTINALSDIKLNGNSINTPKTLSGIPYLATANTFTADQTVSGTMNATNINATTALKINGTSIDTTGALGNVAYKGQDNVFSVAQSITNSAGANLTINSSSGIASLVLNSTTGGNSPIIQFKNNGTAGASIKDDSGLNLFAKSGQNIYVQGFALAVNGPIYYDSGLLTTTNPSDINLKHNIQLIPDGQLKKILLLKPKTWDWNENNKPGVGLIAQDLEEVFPDLVNTDVTGKKGIYSDRTMYYLIKAFQEQNTIIESLKSRIEVLESR